MISWLMGRSDQQTLEDPRASIDRAIGSVLSDGRTDAGAKVTPETVLGHPAVWRCRTLIAKSCARIPCDVYRYSDGDNKERDVNHPAWALIRRRPNEYMTAFRFQRLMFGYAAMGNAYAYIDRFANGRPRRLLVMDPSVTMPVVLGGQLMYGTMIRGETRKLDPSQVFHLQGFAVDPYTGLDLVESLRNAFSLQLAQRKYRAKYFSQNARPNVALEVPPNMSPAAKQNILDSWAKAASGLENAHRAALLEDGVKLHEYSSNLRDNQMVEIEEHELVQIANIFGVPPHKVGAKTNVSYKSLSEENQSWLDEGIDPYLVDFEQEAATKLLSEAERKADSHFFEFNRRAFVRNDIAQRGTFYNQGIQGGWLNRDEVRSAEGYNRIPDGSGQTFLVPVNMQPASAATDPASGNPPASDPASENPPATDPPAEASARALLRIYRRDVGRMVRRVALASEREARSGSNFVQWLDQGIEREHGRTIRDTLRDAAQALGHPGDIAAEQLIETIRRQLLDVAGGSNARQLPGAVKAWGERSIQAAIDGTFNTEGGRDGDGNH